MELGGKAAFVTGGSGDIGGAIVFVGLLLLTTLHSQETRAVHPA